MWHDPIVDEIHQIRRQIEAEHGNDLGKLVAYFVEYQKADEGRLAPNPPRSPDGVVGTDVNIPVTGGGG